MTAANCGEAEGTEDKPEDEDMIDEEGLSGDGDWLLPPLQMAIGCVSRGLPLAPLLKEAEGLKSTSCPLRLRSFWMLKQRLRSRLEGREVW